MHEIMEGTDRINARLDVTKIPPRTKERLEYVLAILDAEAGPPIGFVVDLPSLKVYAALVEGLAYRAWEDYAGFIGVQPSISGRTDEADPHSGPAVDQEKL